MEKNRINVKSIIKKNEFRVILLAVLVMLAFYAFETVRSDPNFFMKKTTVTLKEDEKTTPQMPFVSCRQDQGVAGLKRKACQAAEQPADPAFAC